MIQYDDTLKAKDLFEVISQLGSGVEPFGPGQPVTLSCGGVFLRGRKLPKELNSFRMSVHLPKTGVRVYRLRGESSRNCFQKILAIETKN